MNRKDLKRKALEPVFVSGKIAELTSELKKSDALFCLARNNHLACNRPAPLSWNDAIDDVMLHVRYVHLASLQRSLPAYCIALHLFLPIVSFS